METGEPLPQYNRARTVKAKAKLLEKPADGSQSSSSSSTTEDPKTGEYILYRDRGFILHRLLIHVIK
jgi:hypothetical protein